MVLAIRWVLIHETNELSSLQMDGVTRRGEPRPGFIVGTGRIYSDQFGIVLNQTPPAENMRLCGTDPRTIATDKDNPT